MIDGPEARGEQVARAALAAACCAAVFAATLVVGAALGLPPAWRSALGTAAVLFPSAAGGFAVRTWWYGPAAGCALALGLVAVALAAEAAGGVDIRWYGFLPYAANAGNLTLLGGVLGWGARLADDELRQTSG
ncbi:MAG TPA: hypothetical protein VIO14_10865 [Dehalococcoidia bacterium]